MALTGVDVTGRRLVIFDFDGTLADTIPAITATARTVLLGHGLAEDELGDLLRLVGPPFPQAYSLVYGFSPEEAMQITREYREIYHGLGVAAWPLFDGVRELLEDLRAAGRLTAVASSKRSFMVERALEDNGVSALFDVRRGKPSDEEVAKATTIAQVLDDLGLSAADAVMVGDRHHDVEAASACGMPCVGVTYGGAAAPGELEGAGACAVAATVDELRRVLLGS